MFNTQHTLSSIPIDLFNEIFSRLPIKTIGRFRCVSKMFASRLGSEDFKELFLTKSLTRPRLLFSARRTNKDYVFYSLPHPQNLYEKSSLEVKADFVSELPGLKQHEFLYTSGLFYLPNMCISTTSAEDIWHVIYNPSTREDVILPKLHTVKFWGNNFLGFDPIDKQFKVLLMKAQGDLLNNRGWIHFILTLGTGKMMWRTIKFPFLSDYSSRWSNGICINGVLYYLSQDEGGRGWCDGWSDVPVIVCFDVRTETFKLKPIVIDVGGGGPRQLINHKGKLGITILEKRFHHDNGVDVYVDLYMLVLEEDLEKQEWSKYSFPSPIKFGYGMYVVGMTSTDDIVLSTTTSLMFNVYYLNPKRNSLQSVEVQGIENHDYVHVIMDHVEDLYVNDAKYFKSNIYAHMR